MQHFEDIVIGARQQLGAYTFTADNIKAFARTYDPQAFHLDEEAGRRSLFGALAASGWHTTSAWMKTAVEYGQRDAGSAITIGGASPGFKNLKWPKPVLAGDTVTYFTEVVSKRESVTRPAWGLVFVLNTGLNQRGELVLSFNGSAFVPRRLAPR